MTGIKLRIGGKKLMSSQGSTTKEGDYREMPIFPLWTIYAGLGYTGAQTCKIT